MSQEKQGHGKGAGKEHPKTHVILLSSILIFAITWILDFLLFIFTVHQVILLLSPPLMLFILWPVRIVLFILLLILALIFMRLSEKTVFNEEDANSLKKGGIYAHVRNPMYLGIPIIFIALICLSMSLISIIPVAITFILYTRMVKYEESDLEEIFGEEYLDYKKKVPRWLPRLTPAKFEDS